MSTNGNRDYGIDVIRARPNTYAYGMGIGVMLTDEVYPGFPGDLRNASAYPFPIQYDVVRGVDINALVFSEDKSAFLEPVLKSARRLEHMGCRAIVAECGHLGYFQEELASALSIPVFTSALLQVPLAQRLIGRNKQVGIVCLLPERLQERHLVSAGIDPESNIVMMGAIAEYSCTEFEKLWIADKRDELPTASFSRAESDFVAACEDFVGKNPDLGALVFWCTGFQPFARAVQRAVSLPVFTCSTMLDFAYSVVAHREHYGHV